MLRRLLRARAKRAAYPIRDSALAHACLDGLRGIEIGGAAHNPFNIAGCVFVDFTGDMDTQFKQHERELVGTALPVDVVAPAWRLPFADGSLQYVLTSHVIEHCFDVIGTVNEWLRLVEPGGLVYAIVPHKERTFDKERPRTPLRELLDRHRGKIAPPDWDSGHHYSVWITEDWLELCDDQGWNVVEHQDVDDKVGNGFTVVLRK